MDLKNYFKREIVYVRDLEILFFVSHNTAKLKMEVFHKDMENPYSDCILAKDLAAHCPFTEEYIIEKLFQFDEAERLLKEKRKLEKQAKKDQERELAEQQKKGKSRG